MHGQKGVWEVMRLAQGYIRYYTLHRRHGDFLSIRQQENTRLGVLQATCLYGNKDQSARQG